MLSVKQQIAVVLAFAASFTWVRESAPNAGEVVEAIQKSTGNTRGQAWCASAIYFCGQILVRLGLKWPLARTASCDVLLEQARLKGWLRDTAAEGFVGLVMRSSRDAIHTFFVMAPPATDGSFATIEGNTNPKGGRDGYGMFPRTRGGPNDPTLKAGLSYAFIDLAAALGAAAT